MSVPQEGAPQGRVKELIEEDITRPRSDSTESRTRAWSGIDFDTPGRPRTFSEERSVKKLVVIAVDESKPAWSAFEWFVDYMCTQDFYLVLLHIPEMPSPPLVESVGIRPGDMSFSPGVWDSTYDEAKAKVAKLKDSYETKMKEKQISGKWLTLSTGRKPGEAIVKAAHEYKATFVVMGSCGMSTIRRTLMGSVSDYVLHHAKIPIIICKQQG